MRERRRGVGIGRDVQVVEPQLAPVDAGPALGQLHLALAQRLDLAALEHEPHLEGLEHLVVARRARRFVAITDASVGDVTGLLRLRHRRPRYRWRCVGGRGRGGVAGTGSTMGERRAGRVPDRAGDVGSDVCRDGRPRHRRTAQRGLRTVRRTAVRLTTGPSGSIPCATRPSPARSMSSTAWR